MKIYISGRISGLPMDEVQAKFAAAEAVLATQGHVPVSPLKSGLPVSETWARHMAADIVMLWDCEAIYLLHDWAYSKGATIEKHIAEITGKHIMYGPAVSRPDSIYKLERLFLDVCEAAGANPEAVRGELRYPQLVTTRQVFFLIARNELNAPLERIGAMCNRDHTTVIHGLRKAKELLSVNDEVICEIIEKLGR